MIELAALERREGERSEPSRSGGAANSMRPATLPVPDPEVVAKAQRRKFTAAYKLGIVEEAGRATDPGRRRPAAARGTVLVPPDRVAPPPRHRRFGSAVEEARPQVHPQPPGRGELQAQSRTGASEEETPPSRSHHRRSKKSLDPAGDCAAGSRVGRGELVTAATQLSAEVGCAAACRALDFPRASFYRARVPRPESSAPRPKPARALSDP